MFRIRTVLVCVTCEACSRLCTGDNWWRLHLCAAMPSTSTLQSLVEYYRYRYRKGERARRW